MNQLELKYLAPYLPYGVKFISSMDKPFDEYGKQPIWTVNGIHELFGGYDFLTKEVKDSYSIASCMLLLRPLSQLTQEIKHNGESFVPLDYLAGKYGDNIGEWVYLFKRNVQDLDDAPYKAFQKLLSWHFDVFGLIDRGLAITSQA